MLTVGLPWNGQPVVVSLIQPNLPTIGAPVDRDVAMGRLAQAAHAAEASVPSLCVWPESAVRGDAVNDQNLSSVFSSFAGLTKGYHLVGTSFAESNGAERNSAALYGPDEGLAGRYDKQRLVPFGEWFPARFALAPVAGLFRIPEADVVAGGEQAPLAAREMRLGVLICYESIFPGLARDRVRRGANVLVSVTNDSWAGRSASPRQHFAMSVFRAVETRRYLCAAGLTGVTGLIAPNGAANCAAENEPALVTDLIYLREGLTPYARWGDWFAVLCALVITLVVWRGGRRPDIQAERAP
jgi:apolipoprotein N-acyltransferase